MIHSRESIEDMCTELDNLVQYVRNKIRTNNRQEIRGNILQQVFIEVLEKIRQFILKSGLQMIIPITDNPMIVEHGLGGYPEVIVVDSSDNIILCDIQYINKNSVKVSFDKNISGKIYIL